MWDVQGFVFRVDASTVVNGETPVVGSIVSAAGTVLSDGTWLATTVQIGASASPTTSAAATATPLANATPTTIPAVATSTSVAVPAPAIPAPVIRPSAPLLPLEVRIASDADDRRGPQPRVGKSKHPASAHRGRRFFATDDEDED
jgi:hypothetical protein